MQSSNPTLAPPHAVDSTKHPGQSIIQHPESAAEFQHRIDVLCSQLNQARRMATLGELTSTTTHEFNNILTTVLNYAKLGLRHRDEASRDKAFQRILDAATRASKISGGILAMARNRTDRQEPTSLKSLIEDTLILIEREFRKYRVQLELKLQDTPEIKAAPNEIQRLIINLLINARQATPENGWVRISLQPDSEKQEVVLTIRDSGHGIAKEVLPRIFDPFFSTKSGPDASGKGGTGVGLSACKQIVDEHAGRIRVESTVGKGTAFIIRFPV